MESLNFLSVNIRSILTGNKLDTLSAEALSLNAHVIAISETWLDDTVPDSTLTIKKYQTIIRKDRHTFGGGVAIYIKDNIQFIRRSDLEHETFEAIWIEIFLNDSSKVYLGLGYRPPSQELAMMYDFYNYLSNTVEKLQNSPNYRNESIILLGDFNSDEQTGRSSFLRLKELVVDYALQQMVTFPTRENGNVQSILDCVITDSPDLIDSLSPLPPLSFTKGNAATPNYCDHNMIFFKFHKSAIVNETVFKETYNFKRADYESINNKLSSINWNVLFDTLTVDECVAKLEIIFQDMFRQHIPKHNSSEIHDKSWLNKKVQQAISEKNLLYHKYRKVKSNENLEKYREARNKATSLVREAKVQWESKLAYRLSKTHSADAKWWKLVDKFKGPKCRERIPALKRNGIMLTKPFDKAEALGEYFAELSYLDDSSGRLPDIEYHTNDRLSNIIISHENVFKELNDVNTSKSMGSDGIPNLFLKMCAESLTPCFVILFRKSLAEKTFPKEWKKAVITPVFKKGKKEEIGNYRPISLLPCMSKVFERIVRQQLLDHLISKNLLNKNNSGFIPNDSTTNRLCLMVHQIAEALENKRYVRGVFLDVNRAFNSVWHKGLLFKMEQLGVSGDLLLWFKSYLADRQHRVRVDNNYSSWFCTNAGVPQGSVLGPICFLIFICDISNKLITNSHLYADDTALLSVGNSLASVTDNLQSDLITLSEWSKTWLMSFNPSKTVVVNFSLGPKKANTGLPTIFYENVQLQECNFVKHLGVTITQNLSWSDHIEKIVQKSRKVLWAFRRLQFSLSQESLTCLYRSHVRPILEYASQVWAGCSIADSKAIERVQKEAARIILGLPRSTGYENMLDELLWEKLSDRRKNLRLRLFHRVYSTGVPSYLYDRLPSTVAARTNRHLRNTEDFSLYSSCRTNAWRLSFFPHTALQWNELPHQLRNVPSPGMFKRFFCAKISKQKCYYFSEPRNLNVMLNRLRLGCSNLRSHLFRNGLADDELCSCMEGIEDSEHFLISCPLFRNERLRMFNNFEKITKTSPNNFPSDELCAIFLRGCKIFSDDCNAKILQSLYEYLISTKRLKV